MTHLPSRKTLKKIIPLLLAVLFISGFLACEKDDICVDGDTPLLIVRFYDINDTTLLKPATSLRVIGLGQGNPVNTFTDRSSTDSIGIPLKIDAAQTDFVFILDSATENDAETGNIDTLRFSYASREVFVSRACGFVVNYDNLTSGPPSDGTPWIQDIRIVNPTVQNQTSAHVKIFY